MYYHITSYSNNNLFLFTLIKLFEAKIINYDSYFFIFQHRILWYDLRYVILSRKYTYNAFHNKSIHLLKIISVSIGNEGNIKKYRIFNNKF